MENKIRVLISSTILSEKFLILRIQRDIINVRKSLCKVSIIRVTF
jgi:hypothetical protein